MNKGCLSGIPPASSGPGSGEAKAWVAFDGGTGKMLASFNVRSVRHSATGNYLVSFLRPFATPYFVTQVMLRNVNDATSFMLASVSSTDSSLPGEKRLRTSSAGTATDADEVYAVFYGEQ